MHANADMHEHANANEVGMHEHANANEAAAAAVATKIGEPMTMNRHACMKQL